MLDIPVLSIQASHRHGSDVVRMRETLRHSPSDAMVIMGSPSHLSPLHTDCFLYNSGSKHIPHSISLFLAVLAGRSFVPIPGQEVTVSGMNRIEKCNVGDPHGEGTVTVDGVLLEISIHFVSV